eukprot:1674439-Rhodomonas_salina.1
MSMSSIIRSILARSCGRGHLVAVHFHPSHRIITMTMAMCFSQTSTCFNKLPQLASDSPGFDPARSRRSGSAGGRLQQPVLHRVASALPLSASSLRPAATQCHTPSD